VYCFFWQAAMRFINGPLFWWSYRLRQGLQ